MAKSYSQYCPLAHALDLVGERWALLVVRDLLPGPKRYTDLLDGLPGLGTNILAGRLRDLERGGIVVKRRLPPPAASTVYELTEYGRELDEVMHSLARWGARSLGPPESGDALHPGWTLSACRGLFDGEAARGVRATYELRVAGETVSLVVEGGRLTAREGAAAEPDLVLEVDPTSLFELVSGSLAPVEALRGGRARIEGDPTRLDQFVSIFNLAPRSAVAA
jgi:DNA-binding HxlR family transcriptional regulator